MLCPFLRANEIGRVVLKKILSCSRAVWWSAVLHEDEIIVWIQTAAFINDVTKIYKWVIVHTDLQMCIKYTCCQSYAKFGKFFRATQYIPLNLSQQASFVAWAATAGNVYVISMTTENITACALYKWVPSRCYSKTLLARCRPIQTMLRQVCSHHTALMHA